MYEKAESASNVVPAKLGARRVPVITSIQAGMWAEIVDSFQPGDAGDWLLTDIDLSDSAFALDIRGNSMEPEFKDGDRVIIDPEIAPQPGDFVAAKLGFDEGESAVAMIVTTDYKGCLLFFFENGKAAKVQVQHMVRRLLSLPGDPSPDAADALACAIAHAHGGQGLGALATKGLRVRNGRLT